MTLSRTCCLEKHGLRSSPAFWRVSYHILVVSRFRTGRRNLNVDIYRTFPAGFTGEQIMNRKNAPQIIRLTIYIS
jgi:hypothetical protein